MPQELGQYANERRLAPPILFRAAGGNIDSTLKLARPVFIRVLDARKVAFRVVAVSRDISRASRVRDGNQAIRVIVPKVVTLLFWSVTVVRRPRMSHPNCVNVVSGYMIFVGRFNWS